VNDEEAAQDALPQHFEDVLKNGQFASPPYCSCEPVGLPACVFSHKSR
jgi:hypothetical protein